MQHKSSMMRVVALSLTVLTLGLIAWHASQYKFLSECRISNNVAGVVIGGKVVYEPGKCLSFNDRKQALALQLVDRADNFAEFFETIYSELPSQRLIIDVDLKRKHSFSYQNNVVIIGEKLVDDDFSFELALSKAWSSKDVSINSLSHEMLVHELIVLAYRGYSRTGPLNLFIVEEDALEDYPSWSELCLLDLVPREKLTLCARTLDGTVMDSTLMSHKHESLSYMIAYRFLMKGYFSLSLFERNYELARWISDLKSAPQGLDTDQSIENPRELRNSVISFIWRTGGGKIGEYATQKALAWLDPLEKFDSKLDFALSSFKE